MNTRVSRRTSIYLGAGAATVAAGVALALSVQASAGTSTLQAKLLDPKGVLVGTATFSVNSTSTKVTAKLKPNAYVAPDAFHGFHIHAGTACVADHAQPATSWFVSAGGHLSQSGQTHSGHVGDLPSPLVMANGTAELKFTTDRLDPAVLAGKVVILHAKPDNFGNVPTGTASTQYTPNDPAATTATANTGNAGDRVACGVVRRLS